MELPNEANTILQKAEIEGFLSGKDFSILLADLLVSEGGYVIETGNYENVNAEVALRLAENIKRHPLIWRCFFMVA